MLQAIVRSLFGTANDRVVKRMSGAVAKINAVEPEVEKLSDEALKNRTQELRARLDAGETLDDILVDAFATVREAAKRTLGQRHYDVQLIGGMVLHDGRISEMRTGEGKTLVATLPAYLNALSGKGVHVVTVNDYLASRDADWMGQIYRFLGLTVGCIVHGLSDDQRKEAYAADITYGTNNEFGFDYLRDNMKISTDDMVQRDFNYAIVDEVDNIFIDEARTPLIISGPAEDAGDLYRQIDKLIPKLGEEDYEKDEKQRSVTLTESGNVLIEELLQEAGLLQDAALYDVSNISLVHHVNQALRAHTLFERDTDYIVKDNKVIIIDEFTGRMMEGRRYSEGLHQALEAKEGVEVQQENQTLASITYQNYFKLYPKLAGMTGTAMTEAGEFADIYNLEVVDIPTNVPCVRDDQDDEVYRTAREKYDSILELIQDCRKKNQPVLVGTVSIEKSEHLSGLLDKAKIPHKVLNARHHEQEAYIIAQAGQPGAVTVATNMAGRGTDIQLGGNVDMEVLSELAAIKDPEQQAAKEPEIRARVEKEIAAAKKVVLEAGGLFIIGTERHEARRIDNQLRGRAGRQGDPGASRFFLSLEDDLMRIFGSQRIDSMLGKLGLQEGEAIVHRWINKALEKAQKKVEERNFEIRKNLLRFDDVLNAQRKEVYAQRKEYMGAEDLSDTIAEIRQDVLTTAVHAHIPEKAYAEQWDMQGLHEDILRLTGLSLPVVDWAKEEGIADEEILDRIVGAANRKMAEKAANYGPEIMRWLEKYVLLNLLDQAWKEHLLALDHLRQGISLRAYGQRDPLIEYKREAFNLFDAMLSGLNEQVTATMCHAEVQSQAAAEQAAHHEQQMFETRDDPAYHEQPSRLHPAAVAADPAAARKVLAGADADDVPPGFAFFEPLGRWLDPNDETTWGKVPRNAPCPCESGKKYKQCHGKV